MNLFERLFGGAVPGLSATEAQERMRARQRPYLLDVRSADEYKAGHIAGATLIPLPELKQRLAELPRDREIICVCRSGRRSGSATRQLAAQGYNALNLRGGMMAWTRAGLAVKKGGPGR